ncbi:MAG TPA: GAF domain-containing protein [Thermoanaerobaculia bacterium]|nr:GAF domain-containing protein [Thermoanaerobaculia bacterium]
MLGEAQQLADVVQQKVMGSRKTPAAAVRADAARIEELERLLEASQRDQQELSDQLVDAENLAGKLMSLYVATYQLHVSLDPVEVQNAIAEIAKDLLGASSFALLIKDDVEGGCEVALSQGVREGSRFQGQHYFGGDATVDATLADGILRLEHGQGDTEALAAVPLRVEDAIVGALVILRLLDHKATPLSEDRDILDLLAAHAASALFAARVYSKTDRKLRTLQSLVNLIRGA